MTPCLFHIPVFSFPCFRASLKEIRNLLFLFIRKPSISDLAHLSFSSKLHPFLARTCLSYQLILFLAQSSSVSVPLDYITRTGIDKHAIEVRSKLHPFAQKNLDENVLHLFENALVLGLNWFGHVPPEIAELMKKDAEAPLCFESTSALASHSWVGKNLSRSFPSSKIDRLLPRYGPHWKRVGIYDAILLSKQSVNRDENLLAAALPHGRPVDAVGDYHKRKNQQKLAKPFTIS
ncbi:unnamed protein product [Prunus armeniaca]